MDRHYNAQGSNVGENRTCDQEDWRHIGTFGTRLAMYRKGYKRRLVDQEGNIVIEYTLLSE